MRLGGDKYLHVDVENPNPGQPGAQIHVQFEGRGADQTKYYYDAVNGGWVSEKGNYLSQRQAALIPPSLIAKAFQFLGLMPP